MHDENLFAYDKVLYPNYLHTQTHPDRLAAMTKFFGVDAKSVENCRVLELGCGPGGSLLSFAFDLPGSEFIGVDLSEKQIEIGNQAVAAVGLKNLTLRQGDIMRVTRGEYGEFDYIIAHGLYSWTPEIVRDRILDICRETLAPQGVAFVSYNAQPGCHFRQMAREMMLFHTRNLTSPVEKVNESLGLLKFIIDAAPEGKSHKEILRREFEKLKERNYENIFHDDLADVFHPVYFHEFVAHASRHDLQFVTEVEHFTTKDVNYPKEVLEVLESISNNSSDAEASVIALEQYLDFINNRRFRQTLLCRREVNLSRQPDARVLRQVRIASPLRPVSEKPELSSAKHESFVGEKDEKIEINHPLTKAAFVHLGKIWARSIRFDELITASRTLLAAESGADFEITEKDEEILTEILFQIFCSGMLRLNVHEPFYTTEVSEKPLASPIARWQAQRGNSISTLLCTSVVVQDNLGLELVCLLDGTRNHRQLLADLSEFIKSEKLDQPAEIKQNILRDLPSQLEKNLQDFANMALLIS